jgi:transposase
LGGVPGEVFYDSMKHVVIRRDSGQVYFNVELLHFATTAASGSLSTDGF